MTQNEKQEPSKKQKKQFAKGFKWGKREHILETYTTYALFIGILFQISGILTRKWVLVLVASVLFGIALVFRFLAGLAHKMEKHYNDKLRYGKWKDQK